MAGGTPLLAGVAGCSIEADDRISGAPVELVWGVHGTHEGRLHRPRVIALGAEDRLYIADLTDRIQVFNRDGVYQFGWRTPGLNIDGPSGLTVDLEGNVLVADTHFYRVLVYSPLGELLRQLGDGVQGSTPGRFGYVTDAVRDRDGYYYISEYGDFDRIQVFDPAGKPVRQWGGHGYEAGQFLRPRALALDESNRLFVADSCNHRIQVFDCDGKLLNSWGRRGVGSGELAFPYDLALGPDNTLYVCEYGNSRVQKFTREGNPLALWGGPGRASGSLNNPCAITLDRQNAVHVVDSGNHRVQRFRI
jgi:DNA-binding beta-propeller fold protein YncE